jgi:hypothetical protein
MKLVCSSHFLAGSGSGSSRDSRQCLGTAHRANNVSMNIPVTDTLIAKLMTTWIHSDRGLSTDVIEAHWALGHAF